MAPIPGTSKVKPTILIVDDESSDRILLERALSRERDDYHILTASDGTSAQRILSEQNVDVVITDLRMPGISGLELMQWATENCPGPTWIILTGQGAFDDAVRAVQLGAFDFITKTLGMADSLPVAVRNALRQRELEDEQRRLHEKLSEQNERLRRNVSQLNEACRLMCEQAEALGEDLRRAELIQRLLLPRSGPRMSRFSVDAVYRPCNTVGGDLYDVQLLNDRFLVACVADAAGHGVSAAMLAVTFKHRLQVLDEGTGEPTRPAEALGAVNRCLVNECLAPGLFITAAYCLLDTTTGELTIASAGHPPVVIRHRDGRIEWVYHTGPALGLSSSAQFAEHTSRITRGERMLFYTDGLCEGDLERSLFVEELIVSALETTNLEGQALLKSLLETSARQRGDCPQEDDITMLLLTGASAASTLDNGTPTPVLGPRVVPFSKRTRLMIGSTEDETAVCIEGSGKWTYCATFHEACVNALRDKRVLTLDLSLCHCLDSTFLGTIQQIVDMADRAKGQIRIQGMLPQVRYLFDELGMDRVIRHISPDMHSLPTEMHSLKASNGADSRSRYRILQAHETVAALNENNRKQFQSVIDGLRSEISRMQTDEE